MAHAIIIHGSYGNPEENWFPWLKGELESRGFTVHLPRFPTPEGQNLESWLEVFEDLWQYMRENTIVIGHSIGPAFLLRVLERAERPVRAAFFASGFIDLLDHALFDKLARPFTTQPFDWETIKKNCPAFYLFHGEDDSVVPKEKAQELAQKLDAKLELIPNGQHLNADAGFTEFPRLLEAIDRVLQK